MIDLAAFPERSTGGFQRDPCRGGRHKGAPLAQAGFTLIEIVITLVLVAIIAGVTGMLILQGSQAFVSGERRSDAANQARVALERMLREIRTIRQAGAIAGPIANPSTSLSFTDLSATPITGTTITYARNVAANTIERTEGVGPPPPPAITLADGVTTLQFWHFDKDGVTTTTPANIWQIQIDLTITKNGEPQTVRSRVYPRNFT